MTKVITRPPDIKQAPRTATDTAVHYGYVAHKDIELAGSLGIIYKVQPAHSPYYTVLPARELIPFTNIEIGEVNEEVAADPQRKAGMSTTKVVQRSAGECAREMENAYEAWGFVVLREMTGYSEDDAFAIFSTIQPFAYKLKDIVDELEDNASERIAQTAPYDVTYEDITITMEPLRKDLKAVAEKVRGQMLYSATVAVELGEDKMEKTIQSLNSFHSGGDGKRKADPYDKYIFSEFEKEIPQLVTTDAKKDNQSDLSKLAELLQNRPAPSIQDEVVARLLEKERLLDEKLAKLEALEKGVKPTKKAA